MDNPFFDQPILNSPYAYPARHWELDDTGQPTQQIIERRRRADFITPIPKPRKRKQNPQQDVLDLLQEAEHLAGEGERYSHSEMINLVRNAVDSWRALPNMLDWQVSPETARLLQHWRHHPFSNLRPFFCQVEAVETVIWLTEVAPKLGKIGKPFLEHLADVNQNANPGLMRLALKLATGAGKTTVMAMIIAWQTINAMRNPDDKRFCRGFLLVAPGLTIRDRLRVLLPNDPDSYYQSRELVPPDLLPELNHAKIVITNYHAFKLRERMNLAKGNRLLLQGRGGKPISTLESAGQMLQRVMPELLTLKRVLILNDEAHHCYQTKPPVDAEAAAQAAALKGEDKKEAEDKNEAARLWITGLQAVKAKFGKADIIDLSATPFFLAGSGYREGTLFHWTMSDFSLMDAIECGIVKLPRVPVADNIPGNEVPTFRNLWEHIKADMPKKGRATGKTLDPLNLPLPLLTALDALYGHYQKTFHIWQEAGIRVPPCFIVVCNNTSTSKLVYDYLSGFYRTLDDGQQQLEQGRLPLFRNFADDGTPLARPRTLLIDSAQLESGDALDDGFRAMAGDEIERFRREIVERSGDMQAGQNLSDQELLREVMNTVGKPGRLGEGIRCVVSVSMLTEGWDANTVTHVLGVRAFGTQLLCEQVIGRALRRQSYDLQANGLLEAEYADVLGIPFDFTAKPVIATPKPPRERLHVKAVRPQRDLLEIRFPRVQGYRTELPEERLTAKFDADSVLTLTPDLIGPSITQNAGIIGKAVDLNLEHSKDLRQATLVMHLTKHLLYHQWRDPGEPAKLHLFGQLKQITKQWLDGYLDCKGGTYPAQLLYQVLADMACQKITTGITREHSDDCPVKAILDPYNPTGSTRHVNFFTTKTDYWEASAAHCHLNFLMLDSGWEGEFCRVVESHPCVRAYVKNHNLGFEVPYRYAAETRRYLPDFIVIVDDGQGGTINLVVEIKGYRREDAKEKKAAMETCWLPGVNNIGHYGRWAFAEFTEIWQMEADFAARLEQEFDRIIQQTLSPPLAAA
ncbi:MAG: hypothetical protein RL748_1524 [Pseudomonadota bacterium]|jgi:type III restriction enzyme